MTHARNVDLSEPGRAVLLMLPVHEAASLDSILSLASSPAL